VITGEHRQGQRIAFDAPIGELDVGDGKERCQRRPQRRAIGETHLRDAARLPAEPSLLHQKGGQRRRLEQRAGRVLEQRLEPRGAEHGKRSHQRPFSVLLAFGRPGSSRMCAGCSGVSRT
jgi:hypothetical protein